MKKRLSSFSAIYIIIGMILILFQFYFIGSEMYKINSSNKIFEEIKKELLSLQEKRDEKQKQKEIRSTPEYQDRFLKENFDIYKKGEIVLILPPEEKEKDAYENLTPSELELELRKKNPIDQQWREIFFQK